MLIAPVLIFVGVFMLFGDRLNLPKFEVFQMNEYRNFTCGQLRAADAGKRVKLAGWVHRKRNLGNLCFVDLRDHYGITQCVFDSASPLFEKMQGIRL